MPSRRAPSGGDDLYDFSTAEQSKADTKLTAIILLLTMGTKILPSRQEADRQKLVDLRQLEAHSNVFVADMLH